MPSRTNLENLANQLVEAIERGAPLRLAAQYVGISSHQLQGWLLAGESGDKTYREFARRIHRAIAEVQLGCTSKILDAKEWGSKAWFLERYNPQSWDLHTRHEQDKRAELGELRDPKLQLQDALKRLDEALSGLVVPSSGAKMQEYLTLKKSLEGSKRILEAQLAEVIQSGYE